MTNEIILASAGSGKTYQLTNRYLALMARAYLAGEEPRPDQIVAVTFTRKAAGEFFEEILKKLAAGASSAKEARKIAGPSDDAENPYHDILVRLGPSDYQALLACFIRRMPGLFLGTLDAFFSQIVRSFPAEFGLSGGFEIIDDHAASQARAEVFRRVFQEAADQPEASSFLEAFRLATFGKDESSIQYHLDKFVEDHHHILLSAASGNLWGRAEAIWEKGNPWEPEGSDLVADFARLTTIARQEKLTPKQAEFWDELEEQVPHYHPGSDTPKRVQDCYEKFLAAWPEVEEGEATITLMRKKFTFGTEACHLIANITRRLASDEIKTKLVRTQGIWRLLNEYERVYSEQVRRRGRLTFHDLQVILAGSPDAPAQVLTQGPDSETRLRIDYRLDAFFRHWMLDEFQDTSFLQWSVIANLIDETIQDDSGERSFFQVGDIKQAIYAWRGGDTKLFDDIYERYRDHGARSIAKRNLDVSWRSGRDVIEPLNAIFGDKQALADLEFPPEALERWQWQPHQVAAPNRERAGFTAYYQPKAEDGGKPDKEDCYRLTLALLEEMQPIKNGLSCAVLVQSNKEGRAVVDYVRQHSQSRIPIISESDVAIAKDNPVTQAFLALFRLAAHPHDRFAEQHFAMSPLGIQLAKDDWKTPQLSKRIRSQVHELGFERTLLHWTEVAEKSGLLDDSFARQRLQELTTAARIYDENRSSSLDDFLAFAENYKLSEPNSETAVQVMTIHKSKGLTFDVVLLPQLGGDALITPRNEIAVQRERESRETEWVLDLPRKPLTQADPVLGKYHTHLEAEAGYEQLCKFYVALTRARYANYLIAPPLGKTSKAKNFIKLLDDTLGSDESCEGELGGVEYNIVYESDLPTSRSDWWQHRPEKKKEEKPRPLAPLPEMPSRERPARRTPSLHEEASPQQLFSRANRDARELGSLVHALFQKMEWAEPPQPGSDATAIQKEAQQQIANTLADAPCRRALARPDLQPDESAELWREQGFEVLLDGQWISGVIDRTTIIRDSTGNVVSAHLLDFKTDKVASEAEAIGRAGLYHEQMETYRRAVTLMLGIPAEYVTAKLLFTRLPLVVDLS